ncbi:tetratricopeptide repeat protein, partial [bacterium]|nr:tetratricopeptide repeat protein [bacterium]
KSLACASDWYNLGLAYKYNFMFNEAVEAFDEANKIDPSSKYSKEIVDVRCMQSEREKLVCQGAVSPGN